LEDLIFGRIRDLDFIKNIAGLPYGGPAFYIFYTKNQIFQKSNAYPSTNPIIQKSKNPYKNFQIKNYLCHVSKGVP